MTTRKRTELEAAIRQEAGELLARQASVAEYSARVFGPGGLLSRLWATPGERKRLVKSPLYRELQSQMAELRQREANRFNEEVERLSGRLTVVVPKSLHAGLRSEAVREGVSLSELIRLKLGVPYRLSVRLLAEEAPGREVVG